MLIDTTAPIINIPDHSIPIADIFPHVVPYAQLPRGPMRVTITEMPLDAEWLTLTALPTGSAVELLVATPRQIHEGHFYRTTALSDAVRPLIEAYAEQVINVLSQLWLKYGHVTVVGVYSAKLGTFLAYSFWSHGEHAVLPDEESEHWLSGLGHDYALSQFEGEMDPDVVEESLTWVPDYGPDDRNEAVYVRPVSLDIGQPPSIKHFLFKG